MVRMQRVLASFLVTCAAMLALAGCATPARSRDGAAGDKETADYVSYLRSNPTGHHVEATLRVLRGRAAAQGEFAAPEMASLIERMPTGDPATTSSCQFTISSQSADKLSVTLRKGDQYPMSRQPNGTTKLYLWVQGAEYKVVGAVFLQGYLLLSDGQDPLVFALTAGSGFVYRRGNGVIVTPRGAVVRVEPSVESSAPATTSLARRFLWR